jgi:hypothetical protein
MLEVPPPGWSLSGIDVRSGGSILWFDSDRAGTGAVVVELRSGGCVNYRFDSQPDGWTALATEASGALSFTSRERLAQGYAQLSGGLEGP